MTNQPSNMTKRTLTYDNQKEVMINLDPSLRSRLAQQCPQLRTLEKSTPLIYGYIRFENNSPDGGTTINRVKHTVGIYRKNGAPEEGAISTYMEIDENGEYDRETDFCIKYSVDGKMKEQWEYNKESTLAMAQKQLHTHLFGNRDFPIEVKFQLEICDSIDRLPEGIKFRTDCLIAHAPFTEMIPCIETLLTPDSFPLKCLSFQRLNEDAVNHPVIRSADTICFQNFDGAETLRILRSLRNSRIAVTYGLQHSEYIPLIEDLKINQRENGSLISFDPVDKWQASRILNLVKQHFTHREDSDGDVHISANHNSQIWITTERYNHLGFFTFLA